MKKVWFSVFSFIFFTLLLSSPVLSFADDPNEVAYQNRFSLKSGTILNSEGEGDCLIFPYYDVRTIDGKHQITEFQVQNVGEYGIAAKLRIREWSRGREVFSKDIWIPSNGVWTGTIEISDDGTNAVLMSSDHVILRYDSTFFYLSNPFSDGSPFSTKYIRKNNGESTLYGYIEVIGEEKTSPESVIGRVGRLAKSERDCPNTFKGKTVIRRVEDGVSMGYDAAVIGNFSRGQGSLFRSVGSTFPRLDIGEDTLDQSEFQLSKCEIRGSYSLDPSTQSRTSMIVTFPTKHFHFRNGNRINRVDNPFEALKETRGEIVGVLLSEEGEKIADSEINLPFSVNVIGLYKEDTGSLTGIDNVSLPTGSSELGEAMLTSGSLSQRFLIPDFENYFAPNQGKFMMYNGLPAVGLVLQESQDSGTLNVNITPVGYSRCFTPSNVEVVITPATPSGPTTGFIGTSYTFTASGGLSSVDHAIQYFFDWGDGTDSDWLPVWTESASKVWTTVGVFTVKVKARCATHTNIVSNWSNGLVVDIGTEAVSTPIVPTGPQFVVVNKEKPESYTYTTGGSMSSFGHPVEYQFDWKGDGSDVSDWGPFIQTKTWTEGGVYWVRARARCTTHTDIVSNWSNGLVVTVEAISTPTILSGPTIGIPGTTYTYTYSTGGSVSNIGHPVQYLFSWGDNTDSGWLPVGTTTGTKSWSTGGEYAVKAKARCATDLLAVSDWTPELKVKIELISTPSTPVGPTSGDLGASYSFSTGGAVSNLGHSVEYQFDWGDGTFSSWGSSTQSKSWSTYGRFLIKARARCVTDTSVVSDWSSGLTFVIELVTVPSQPFGPLSVMRGQPNTYTASGAISNLGDPLEYQFDWKGDGTDLSAWIAATVDPVTFVTQATAQKIWTNSGTYTVRARARCSVHPTFVSDWSSGLVVVVEFINPPVTPTGSTSGTVGEGYSYNTGGSSSDRVPPDPVQYQFDWGDGTTSEWLPIGTTSVGKAWTNPGTYAVRAHARCGIHTIVISDWSPGLTVTIVPGPPPQAETISTPFIEDMLSPDRGTIYEVSPNRITGRKNIAYTFGIQNGVSNLGHTTEHQFDWGDGTFSEWGGAYTKAWATSLDYPGYIIKVRARCAQHPTVVSGWSSGLEVLIDYITQPSRPTGPTSGTTATTYTYSTGGSTSDINQQIQYRFHWGDGTSSGWLPVGTVSANKMWTVQGTYTVRVDARGWDFLGASLETEHFSYFSAELSVKISKIVVESVSNPYLPTGPASGVPGTPYTYSTGGSVSNLGHSVQYLFDWGDGTDTNWLPIGTTSATKSWPTGGTYNVKVKARCATDISVVSDWTPELEVKIELISRPNVPVGPVKGFSGDTFNYMTGGATSNIGDTVEYQFDWKGDGTDLSPWGSTAQSKTWATGGTYSVKARARCVTHPTVISDWSAGLTVNIELISVSTLTGPTSVIVNSPASTYTATAISNIGDPVQIRFAFSDGADSGWLPVGTTSFSKTWTSAGSFTVTAQARCAIHTSNVSAPSDPLAVTVNNPAPTLTSILPNSGNRLETLDVVLTGTNFIGGSSVSFSGSGITVNSRTVNSATQITANITIAGTATVGARSVSVTNPTPGGGTVSLSFTVNNPAPTLTSILPASGAQGDTLLDVVFTGTNFISVVSSVSFSGSGITVNSTTVDSATQITANITIAGTATVGARSVSVTNPPPGGGTSSAQTFTVN